MESVVSILVLIVVISVCADGLLLLLIVFILSYFADRLPEEPRWRPRRRDEPSEPPAPPRHLDIEALAIEVADAEDAILPDAME